MVLAEIMRKHINEDNLLAVVSEYVCNVTLRQQCSISAQVNNILDKNVGGKISSKDWQTFGQVGANIGQDLLVAGSTAKVLRSVSNEFDQHVHSLLLLVTFRASCHSSPPCLSWAPGPWAAMAMRPRAMGPRTPAPSWRPCPAWSSWSSPGSAAETSRPIHSPAEEPLIGAVNKSGIMWFRNCFLVGMIICGIKSRRKMISNTNMITAPQRFVPFNSNNQQS